MGTDIPCAGKVTSGILTFTAPVYKLGDAVAALTKDAALADGIMGIETGIIPPELLSESADLVWLSVFTFGIFKLS